MKHSSNEVEATCLKAARGAKWPLAQAQECARAIAHNPACIPDFLQSLGMSSWGDVTIVGNTLEFSNSHPVIDLISAMDAVSSGCDRCVLADMNANALTKALIVWRVGEGFDLTSKGTQLILTSGPDNLERPAIERADVAPDHWAALQEFAAKTYVPETEESRLKGAGAGLTDND